MLGRTDTRPLAYTRWQSTSWLKIQIQPDLRWGTTSQYVGDLCTLIFTFALRGDQLGKYSQKLAPSTLSRVAASQQGCGLDTLQILYAPATSSRVAASHWVCRYNTCVDLTPCKFFTKVCSFNLQSCRRVSVGLWTWHPANFLQKFAPSTVSRVAASQ